MYRKEYYLANKQKYKDARRRWDIAHPNGNREKTNKSNLLDKIKTFELLGNKCVRCGFSDIRALQIDHINGGGKRELSSEGFTRRNYHKIVRESVLNKVNKYQLLCANCNWIRRHEDFVFKTT